MAGKSREKRVAKRVFIRARRIFECNNVAVFMKFGELSVDAALCRCTSEEFISVIYCGPPTDYQADRDIKERPDKTGFNLRSLPAMASSLYVYFPCQRIDWRSSRQY